MGCCSDQKVEKEVVQSHPVKTMQLTETFNAPVAEGGMITTSIKEVKKEEKKEEKKEDCDKPKENKTVW